MKSSNLIYGGAFLDLLSMALYQTWPYRTKEVTGKPELQNRGLYYSLPVAFAFFLQPFSRSLSLAFFLPTVSQRPSVELPLEGL